MNSQKSFFIAVINYIANLWTALKKLFAAIIGKRSHPEDYQKQIVELQELIENLRKSISDKNLIIEYLESESNKRMRDAQISHHRQIDMYIKEIAELQERLQKTHNKIDN